MWQRNEWTPLHHSEVAARSATEIWPIYFNPYSKRGIPKLFRGKYHTNIVRNLVILQNFDCCAETIRLQTAWIEYSFPSDSYKWFISGVRIVNEYIPLYKHLLFYLLMPFQCDWVNITYSLISCNAHARSCRISIDLFLSWNSIIRISLHLQVLLLCMSAFCAEMPPCEEN